MVRSFYMKHCGIMCNANAILHYHYTYKYIYYQTTIVYVSGDRDLYLLVPVRLRDAGAALPAQALHHRVPGVNRVKEKEVKMTIYDHMIMIF